MPTLMCDREEIQLFFEGKIPPSEEQPWLDHLETCPHCQSRMEELAAGSNWWKDAKTFLSTDSGIAAFSTPTTGSSVGLEPESGEPESGESGPEPISLDFLAPTDDPESLGRLGTYEVTGVIGRGGSGIVLKAFDRSLNRYVAIKVLSPHLATSGAARKRFAREGQAAAAVVHEHVIPIFAVAAHQNLPFIVMQYFPGRSLQQRLDRDGPLELREILRIGLQTARGLAAAHAQGLVHRDVKPANILLADGIERVTLSDFGLARAVDDARLTRTGWLAGTPEYMSPEQSRGKGMDARSDLFSLGSVLYAVSTGRVPFQAETSYGTLRLVTDEEPTPIRQLNPDIPEWLCTIIAKLMAKQAENRFSSASELADLLETCLAHVQQPDSTPLPESLVVKKPEPVSKGIGWRRTLAATLLGLAGFFLGGFALWQASGPPDIAGWWTGEDWGKVQLKHLGSGAYEGTYTDTFGKGPGEIQLKWSRIERRFSGNWSEGEDRFGELSIRLVKEEIRGALTTDPKSKINPATPRLADLVWVKAEKTRSEQTGTDSNSKNDKVTEGSIQRLSVPPNPPATQSANSKSNPQENPSTVPQILGEWQPRVYRDGFTHMRDFQQEFPPPHWKFQEGEIVFETNPPIRAKYEIMNGNNPVLFKLTYPNMANQFFRIQMEEDILRISSRKNAPPGEVTPSKEGEYWELVRIRPGSAKMESLVCIEKPELKKDSTVLVYPPGKEQLFPLQPAPKDYCPNLLVEFEENGIQKRLIGPMERKYSNQTWSVTNGSNRSARITWSYKGRKVKNSGSDDEFYDFSIQTSEGDGESYSKDLPVTYSRTKIPIAKTKNFTLTIEPSWFAYLPQKTVQEDKILNSMLTKLASIKEGSTETFNDKIFLKKIILKNNTSKQYVPGKLTSFFNIENHLKMTVIDNSCTYSNTTYRDFLNVSSLFPNLIFETFRDDFCELIREESGQEGNYFVYKIISRHPYTGKPSERLLWVEKSSHLPAKMESFITFFNQFNQNSPVKMELIDSHKITHLTKFDWTSPILDSELSMAPPEGVRVNNLELYLNSTKKNPAGLGPDGKENSFLTQIQGDWLVNRVIDPQLTEIPIDKVGERFWNIKNKTLTTRGDRIGKVRTLPTQFSILEDGPPVRIEFTLTRSVLLEGTKPKPGFPSPAPQTDPLTPTETEKIVSSLWELKSTPDGDRLLVLSGTDGLKPTELKPAKGFVYLELVRRPPGLQNNTKTNPVPPTPSDQGAPMAMNHVGKANPPFREPLMKTGLAQFQGEWIPVKQVDENLKDLPGINQPGEMWSIQGEIFTTGGNPYKPARLTMVAVGPPMQLDFLLDVTVPSPLDTPITKGIRVPSLWSLDESGKLRVVIGKEGKRPEKLEPTPGFKYFELIRREKAIPDSAAGTPPRPTGQNASRQEDIPYINRLFNNKNLIPGNTSPPKPELPGSARLSNPSETEKTEVLKHLQGNWVIEKQIILKDKGERIQEKAGDVWTIEGNTIRSWNRPDLHDTLEIKSTRPQIRIDWVSPNRDRPNTGGPTVSETLIPTLWERSGNKLKVIMAPGGKLPEIIEPTLDCIYFELSRKTKSPTSPSKPTSPQPDKNGETEKEEILKHLQGNWVIEKQIILKAKGERIQEKTGDVWTIDGSTVTSWGRPDLHNKLEIKSTRPQIRIDWVYPNRDGQNTGGTSISETLIPSVWERNEDKLKVVLAPEGKLPEKIEPSLDCIYFELVRKPKTTTGPLGFPLNYQGKWKVTKMVGPDLKEDALNLGEIVSIEPDRLRVSDQVKRAELVDTGGFLKGNLVVSVVSPKDGTKTDARILSLWEIKGDKLRFVCGKEVPTKVEPSAGTIYYELDRVKGETKKPMDPSPLTEPKPVAIAPENPVQPTAKEAILKRLQGRWVVVKQYGTDGKPFEVASTGNVPLWTISRDNLHYGNLPQFELTRMEILDASFPCKIQLVNSIRSTSLVGLYAIKENKYTSLWNIENGKLKILSFYKEMNYQKVEPTIGCTYYELVPFGEESPSPKADPAQSEKPNEKNLPTKREDSFWMPPAESPPDSGPCLFLYQGNRGGKAPLVQPLWRDLSPVSKTAVFGNPDRPFEITWTFKKIVLLNPSPDAECYEFHKRYFPLPGIPTPEPQTKQVTFIGLPIEIFRDDRYIMVLMPNKAETKPKDASADPQLFEAMLDKIGSMPAASMVGKAIPTADHQLPLREVFHVKGQRTRKEQFHREQLLLTQVCDFHTKKSLLLNVPGKFGNQLDYKTLPPPEYRHVEKFENPLNLIEKSLRGTLPEFVTSQPVDGIPCQVFRVQPREEGYESLCGPWMVWIDPKLRLPVLIRGATPTGVLEYSMFQWNPVWDDAIFSQELPKSFAIQETWSNPVNQVNRSQSEPIQWKYLKQTVDPKKENPVKSPTPSIPPPQASRDPRNEIPSSKGAQLVYYRKKTDGVDRIVRTLPRHPFGFDQPRKTEQVVFQGAQFSVTWTGCSVFRDLEMGEPFAPGSWSRRGTP